MRGDLGESNETRRVKTRVKPATILASSLKDAREKSGLTQKQVADYLGYSTAQFISSWERAEREPPLNVIWRLAELYRFSAEDFFNTMLSYRTQVLIETLRAEFDAAKPRSAANGRGRNGKNNR